MTLPLTEVAVLDLEHRAARAAEDGATHAPDLIAEAKRQRALLERRQSMNQLLRGKQ